MVGNLISIVLVFQYLLALIGDFVTKCPIRVALIGATHAHIAQSSFFLGTELAGSDEGGHSGGGGDRGGQPSAIFIRISSHRVVEYKCCTSTNNHSGHG